ncbi:HCP-like protein [Cylindrobasidium torrendii FP15055 ss-10]|uniref:HCP-like protein n=1 Tax=Cylindrobasidium torrendii FP15055 ss-10 TaxID=1314674 RepID=A0A0D7B5S8_9AGAR|nr:HCP-like protein [Cylindrobasidium torrendii FP15055 ss-10]
MSMPPPPPPPPPAGYGYDNYYNAPPPPLPPPTHYNSYGSAPGPPPPPPPQQQQHQSYYNNPPSTSYDNPPPASYNAGPPTLPNYRTETPMVAPRPHATSNPAVDLEGLANLSLNSPPPPPLNNNTGYNSGGFAGGFSFTSSHPPGPASDVMASMQRVTSIGSPPMSAPATPAMPQNTSPDACPPLPTIKDLTEAAPTTPAGQIAWCRDAVYLIERQTPHAESLSSRATSLVSALAASNPEAVYLRACLAAPTNPRQAFRDFEAAARAGCHVAWFRLGRDYEQFGDSKHAKECYDRGVRLNVVSCVYRMAMAHMLGQLGVTQDASKAMGLLKRAADMATMYAPEPAYVYALILMDEFTAPASATLPPIALPSSPLLAAKPYLTKAANLHFPPAQYKIAHAYEFASYPFRYDPLLSVDFYSKASQAGEREADMALSKWFLCGAEGAFDKDEGLARVFAERAAGELASAMFAMGYYNEVGVGGPVDLTAARSWYTKAADKGNTDAVDRLQVLSQPDPAGMGRAEHEKMMGATLVRTRTNAKMQKHNPAGPPPPQPGGRDVIGLARKNTLGDAPPPMPAMPAISSMPPYMVAPQAVHTPPLQQMQPPMSPPAHTLTPPAPQARPQSAQQAMAGRQRYSLVDPGSSEGQGQGRRPHSQSPPRQNVAGAPGQQGVPAVSTKPAGGRVPSGVAATPQPAVKPAARPGPQTFADMGIQGSKVEDEKCVVM